MKTNLIKLFILSFPIFLSYNSISQQLDSIVLQAYQNSEWGKTHTRYSMLYSNNLVTERRHEIADSNGDLQTNTLELKEYTSFGKINKNVQLIWRSVSQSFDTGSVNLYEYDAQERLIKVFDRNGIKDSITYDQSGNVSSFYFKLQGKWTKIKTEHRSNNRLDSILSLSFDTSIADYKVNGKSIFSYYPNDSIMSFERWTFSQLGDTFRRLRTDSFFFDQNFRRTTSKDYRFNPKHLRTLNTFRYENNGLKVYEETKRSLSPNDSLSFAWRRIFYYSEPSLGTENSVEARMKIYPNPASTRLFIDCEDCGEQLHVFTMQGQLLNTYPLEGKGIPINIEALAPGNYLLRSKESFMRLQVLH